MLVNRASGNILLPAQHHQDIAWGNTYPVLTKYSTEFPYLLRYISYLSCVYLFRWTIYDIVDLLTEISIVVYHDWSYGDASMGCHTVSPAPVWIRIPGPLNYFYTPVWKTGRIMPWQCPFVRLSVCPSVRPSVFSGLFFNMLWDINLKLGIYIQ